MCYRLHDLRNGLAIFSLILHSEALVWRYNLGTMEILAFAQANSNLNLLSSTPLAFIPSPYDFAGAMAQQGRQNTEYSFFVLVGCPAPSHVHKLRLLSMLLTRFTC
jgi:hypothetical protein